MKLRLDATARNTRSSRRSGIHCFLRWLHSRSLCDFEGHPAHDVSTTDERFWRHTLSSTDTTSRVAIVTGGSRGIGRQTVKRLATDGYALVVAYAANRGEADAAVAEAVDAGAEAFAMAGDVADESDIAALFDAAEARFGGIDVVVHAAGRLVLATLTELDLVALDAMHRTNIRGTFVVDKLPARRLWPGGSIINFSTSVIGLAFPTYAAYAASKARSRG